MAGEGDSPAERSGHGLSFPVAAVSPAPSIGLPTMRKTETHSAEYTLAETSVAALAGVLIEAGIPKRDVGETMLGVVVSLARDDPDHWISALYAAGVLVARASSSGKGN